MSVSDVAEGAIRLIQEYGWAKHRYTGRAGEVCLTRALVLAATGEEELQQAREVAARLIRQHFPERMPVPLDWSLVNPGAAYICLPDFNDHVLTTLPDVEFLLKQVVGAGSPLDS